MMKRALDIVCSALGLLLLLPAFALVALLIKLDSGGPVLFVQKRVGKDFMPFDLYKFRSMTVDAPRTGPAITAGRDVRVTRVGKAIRKSKIDELPQLINVLKGDMSLVGPRPEVPRYVELFRDDYREVLSVRPGITDYASIRFRDEEAVLATYPEPEQGYIREVLPQKIRLAKLYINERSLWLDLKLLVRTAIRIVA
jgi:lipopolysaccharide/colanic/teichoic acid biosynthesis glycosyltransferase